MDFYPVQADMASRLNVPYDIPEVYVDLDAVTGRIPGFLGQTGRDGRDPASVIKDS